MRDRSKEYVVTGPYVTMKVNTRDGKRVVGFFPPSPVPPDVDGEEFDNLLRKGLIAAEGEEPASAVGASPDVLLEQARAELASARLGLAEAQARYENAQEALSAAEKGAESQAARDAARAETARQVAAGSGAGGSQAKAPAAKAPASSGSATSAAKAGGK